MLRPTLPANQPIIKPIKPASPKPKAKIELTPPDPNAKFQAIGVIVGEVFVEKDRVFVQIDQNKYPLTVSMGHKKSYFTLRKIATDKPKRLRLMVYPRCTHFPARDKEMILKFQLVAFGDIDNKSFFLPDWTFQLSGLWQFIPVCKCPVVSVFRNFSPSLLKDFKASDALAKIWLAKTNHVPLNWRDSILPPKLKRPNDQQTVPFVSVLATFRQGKFYFNSLAAMPSMPPQFIKINKKPKARKKP